MFFLASIAILCVLSNASSASRTCTSDLDCSLNGACSSGSCKCDWGWKGSHCERLKLLPARLSDGFNHLATRNRSVSSWGATQGPFDEQSQLFHTFVGELAHGCGIDSYESNESMALPVLNREGGHQL